MQKLGRRNTYTPLNTSQVQCNCDSELNMEKTLNPKLEPSVQDLKTFSNNGEVNQRLTNKQGLQLKVFVLNLEGKPIMPTKPSRARKMLENGKAKVIKRFPFTIQLTVECKNQTQEINLGVDTGFGNIGFSATTKTDELICGTLVLDGKTKERLDEKRMYRRSKRARHHWYRKPRFLNRKRKEGWLPPSIQRRYDTHLNLIERIKKILPISNIILEIAKFDIQKLENPEIKGTEYHQGNLYDYQNMRSYLMSREKGKCQFCGKDFKGQSSHIHHIKPRSKGGNNRPNNLALLHEKCHEKLHEKHLEKKLKSNSKDYKQSTFMSIIHKKFLNDIPTLSVTYGNVTFVNRNKLGLEKTHYNDAFVIARGTNQSRVKPFEIIQKHRNNRVLQLNRNGFKPSIKKEKSKVNPLDIFWIGKKSFVCKGMSGIGRYICYGSVKKREYFKFSDVTKIFKFGSFAWGIQ